MEDCVNDKATLECELNKSPSQQNLRCCTYRTINPLAKSLCENQQIYENVREIVSVAPTNHMHIAPNKILYII